MIVVLPAAAAARDSGDCGNACLIEMGAGLCGKATDVTGPRPWCGTLAAETCTAVADGMCTIRRGGGWCCTTWC